MQLLLVRHAVAQDRDVYAKTGQDDDLRPLTADGRRRMRDVVNGLLRMVPRIDVLATSKLVRAVETAGLIAKSYDIKSSVELPALAPGGKQAEMLAWLKKQDPNQTIALVGHEPDMGRTASWLLSGMRSSFMPMKKGGACLLSFERAIEPGAARLVWSIPPKQLRKLG